MARVGAVKIEELMILAEVVTGEAAQHPDHAQKLQFSMVSVRVKV